MLRTLAVNAKPFGFVCLHLAWMLSTLALWLLTTQTLLLHNIVCVRMGASLCPACTQALEQETAGGAGMERHSLHLQEWEGTVEKNGS